MRPAVNATVVSSPRCTPSRPNNNPPGPPALSADWSSVPVAVPYANLTNPQTLNLYSMVSDDPESFADLDGHDPQQDRTRCVETGGSCPSPQQTEVAESNQQTQTQQQAEAARQQAQQTSQTKSEVIGIGGDKVVLRNWTTTTSTTTDSAGNKVTVTTETYTQVTYSSETGKFQSAAQSSQTTVTGANGQQFVADSSGGPRPISEAAARSAIGEAAFGAAQASATPGAVGSYFINHKSALKGLLVDEVLAFTPTPEIRWLAKAKEVVEKALLAHTAYEFAK